MSPLFPFYIEIGGAGSCQKCIFYRYVRFEYMNGEVRDRIFWI